MPNYKSFVGGLPKKRRNYQTRQVEDFDWDGRFITDERAMEVPIIGVYPEDIIDPIHPGPDIEVLKAAPIGKWYKIIDPNSPDYTGHPEIYRSSKGWGSPGCFLRSPRMVYIHVTGVTADIDSALDPAARVKTALEEVINKLDENGINVWINFVPNFVPSPVQIFMPFEGYDIFSHDDFDYDFLLYKTDEKNWAGGEVMYFVDNVANAYVVFDHITFTETNILPNDERVDEDIKYWKRMFPLYSNVMREIVTYKFLPGDDASPERVAEVEEINNASRQSAERIASECSDFGITHIDGGDEGAGSQIAYLQSIVPKILKFYGIQQ